MKKQENSLRPLVQYISNKSMGFLALAKKYQTPFYAYDERSLDLAVTDFNEAFKKHISRFESYYALKLNHHQSIVNRVVEKGLGLDVASRRELLIALKTSAKRIVYYSPGKSKKDLQLAIKHNDRVRIHIDSFQELHLLGQLTIKLRKKIEVSVRVNFPDQGDWKKYGIPLNQLHSFFTESYKYNNLVVDGIHFHQSRNKDAKFYIYAIKSLSKYLKNTLSKVELTKIKFIDFGGGFEPYLSEGQIVRKEGKWPSYSVTKTSKIEEYAKDIGEAIKKYLDPIISVVYFAEPGRYICNSAMHIVLTVSDVKDDKNCILDGGVNMVGWQRFEFEYFPLINITSKNDSERKINMWGNLCTTWDIWGYHIYGGELSRGDIVVVPNQGALTYSLAQSFINEIPKVYKL